MKKAIIFDSGTLISFSMNGTLNIFRRLGENFDGDFIITTDVKKEIIDKPLGIKKYELEALKLKQLLDEKIIKMPGDFGISPNDVKTGTEKVISMANAVYSSKKEIQLIDRGEASCFALSEILNKKKIPNIISIDERTARSLVETPEDLKKYLGRKLHTNVNLNKANQKYFSQFRVIRSTELAYVAYKKGLVKIKHPDVLGALLWAMKSKGCAISRDEIEKIKRLVKENIKK